MRRIISIFFTLVLLFAVHPTISLAQTCSSLQGHCVFSGSCFKGSPIKNSDCGFLQLCCPNSAGNTNQAGVKCSTITGAVGVNTAIGCISTEWSSGDGGFIGSVIRLAIGLGGGFALLLMLYGTFIITTSAGIPDKLKAGNEIITSAIIGLIFIILSIVLMQLIGVSILGIPGL